MQTKESTSSFTKTLNGEYASLKAASKKNVVVGQPKSASVPKGAKLDMFGYTPAKDKQLPDLSKLHAKVKKNLFVTGWTLNTAGQAGAKQLAAGLKAAKKASYVYTLGYDGLYDTDVVGSDGRNPEDRPARQRRHRPARLHRLQERLIRAAARPRRGCA